MADVAEHNSTPEGFASDHRNNGRARVDIDCDIRIGNRAWRRARLANLPDVAEYARLLERDDSA